MESKRKNVYIALFVITTIIAGCLAAYFGIMRNKDARSLDELQAKLSEAQELLEEENLNSENNKTDSTGNIVEANTNTMSDEDIVKKINNIGYVQTELIEHPGGQKLYKHKARSWRKLCYVSVSYNSKQDAEIVFSKGDDGVSLVNYVKTNVEAGFGQNIEGLDKKVTDFIVGGQSQDIIFPMVYFLMEDGTISYLNTKQALETGNFTVSNNLNNLKNIVKLEVVDGLVDEYYAIDINNKSYNLSYQFINETKCEY